MSGPPCKKYRIVHDGKEFVLLSLLGEATAALAQQQDDDDALAALITGKAGDEWDFDEKGSTGTTNTKRDRSQTRFFHREDFSNGSPNLKEPATEAVARLAADSGDDDIVCLDVSRTPRTRIPRAIPVAKRAVATCAWGADNGPASEDELPICCVVCKCSDKQRAEYPSSNGFIQCSQNERWHRRCCHNSPPDKDARLQSWCTLGQGAIQTWADAYPKDSDEEERSAYSAKVEVTHELSWVEEQQILDAYRTAKAQRTKMANDGSLPCADNLLWSNETYAKKIVPDFNKRLERVRLEQEERRRMVVLDCFAGIGTLIVVLKRLGIDIAKIIHVEHDKVANHVYRHQHDRNYNPSLHESHRDIDHVYFSRFEDIEEDIQGFCEKHGPIDLIVGGPPCSDYSKVNAQRQGVHGSQGQYMLRFGRMIRMIERYQDQLHPGIPLNSCIENVVLNGADLKALEDAYGNSWGQVVLNASIYSPTSRERGFLLDFPVDKVDYNGPDSRSVPTPCLEEGYHHPAHLIENEEGFPAKAACLMASRSRIDDVKNLRMFVFKKKVLGECVRYLGRPLTVRERELLMGYFAGYVEEPMKYLFEWLCKGNFALWLSELGWMEVIPPELYTFAGNYHDLPCPDAYRFEVVKPEHENATPVLRVKLAPPADSRAPVFFNEEEYSKQLIGLAYSVPVMEHLLRTLTPLFKTKEYAGYDYTYAWRKVKKT